MTFGQNALLLLFSYRVPELGNWYSGVTQIFSFVSHRLRDIFLEIGNIDIKDRSFNWILDKKVTEYEKRWGTISAKKTNSGTLLRY